MRESQILMKGLKKKIQSSARDRILTRFPGLRKASKWPTVRQAVVKGGDDSHTEGCGDNPKFWKI